MHVWRGMYNTFPWLQIPGQEVTEEEDDCHTKELQEEVWCV